MMEVQPKSGTTPMGISLRSGTVAAVLLLAGCTNSSPVELPDLPSGHPARAGGSQTSGRAFSPRLVEDEITRGTSTRLEAEPSARPMDMRMDEPMDMKMPENKPTAPSAKVSYTCPMHPEIHKEAPGKCPICGMKLVEEKSSPHSH